MIIFMLEYNGAKHVSCQILLKSVLLLLLLLITYFFLSDLGESTELNRATTNKKQRPLNCFMTFWNIRKAEPGVCSRKESVWLSLPVSSISASLKRSNLVSKSKRVFAASGSTTRSLIYWKPANPTCRVPLHWFVRLTRAASPKISSHGAPTSQSSNNIYQQGKCSLKGDCRPDSVRQKAV